MTSAEGGGNASLGDARPASGRVCLGPGGEFDLIRRLLGPNEPLAPGVRIGPGDDCLVLEGGWVLSVDLFVEGVHFRREWISPEEAGYRAAAAALSDLAAMAAEPVGALLGMALDGSGDGMKPPPIPGWSQLESTELAVRVQAGAAEACRREGIQILGGDLSRTAGPLALALTVVGRSQSPVLRSGARPGDEVWVTGWLGGSSGAVALWTGDRDPPTALREAFARPRPRIQEALWLSHRADLHGLIDLSDGLAGDAGHLAAASGVGLVLQEGRIPIHPAVVGDLAPGIHLVLALGGGEDYELCLTVPSKTLDDWVEPFQDSFGIPLSKVGRVVAGDGVLLEREGGERSILTGRGFSHFTAQEDG